ncbi:hypothetical protein AVEN_251396-1 [Araneus ventricosus]|uniref:Uncharacterized protein n=1 Tax=Araneus ventricosus TaxID=182803 RepID=A0A4Y2RZW5_ARAVE|nr:hypothetical protein AVEN_251396-1 [Araneus ventricosus]
MVHAACIIAVSSPPPRVTPNARAQADDFLSYSKQRFLHSLQKFSGLLFSAKTRRESLRPITQVRSGQIRSDQDRTIAAEDSPSISLSFYFHQIISPHFQNFQISSF